MVNRNPNTPGNLIWTGSQMNALRGLLLIFAVVLAGRLVINRTFVNDPQPAIAQRSADLADRLNPNLASWQEFAAIPGLGEKKAHAIIDYRESWLKTHPREPAYSGPQDLRNIKGIGPATVSNLSPFLTFDMPRK